MNAYDNIEDLPDEVSFGLVIGNFDGVHRGHRNLLKEVKDLCHEKGVEPLVMTFVPHPMTILKNESSFLIN
ncbi:MAG: adenylyltransferase/cytidyltransferase family protein, partial [Halobacteriovoraceae bacterium]|nr:adenylyltransferase/cytidyltransferase family protein [Halobacteriovoraceae bacterium]